MNPTLKLSLSILGGTAIISGATWYITKKILDKRHNAITCQMRRHYAQKEKEFKEVEKRVKALEQAAEDTLGVVDKDEFFDAVNYYLVNGLPKEDEEDVTPLVKAADVTLTSDADINYRAVGERVQQGIQDGLKAATGTIINFSELAQKAGISVDECQKRFEEFNNVIRQTERDDPDKEWDPDEPDETDLDQEVIPIEPRSEIIHTLKSPIIISQDECGETGNDIECLIYYDEDGILCTEGEEVLNIAETIGDEAPEHFADNLLYVRNDRLGIDYEVRWEPGSYARTVLGIDYPQDDSSNFERMKRRKEYRNTDDG